MIEKEKTNGQLNFSLVHKSKEEEEQKKKRASVRH